MGEPAKQLTLGPAEAKLTVQTARDGAAAALGHDLVLAVTDWRASVEIGAAGVPTAIQFDADRNSLRVEHGTGGVKALSASDRRQIEETIRSEVLRDGPISFRSKQIEATEEKLRVAGELTLGNSARELDLEIAWSRSGPTAAVVALSQSDWGIKPYSTMFGALKVADVVEIRFDQASAGST